MSNWDLTIHAFENFQAVPKTNSGTSRDPQPCLSCQHVQGNFLKHTEDGKELFWLVDVVRLKDTIRLGRNDRNKKCVFCLDVYEAFWTFQPGDYRLYSQLWAQDAEFEGFTEETWKAKLLSLPRIWQAMRRALSADGALAHFPTNTYDATRCETETCCFCKQDKFAKLEFSGVEQLCEICRAQVSKYDAIKPLKLQPVVPLILKFNTRSDGKALSTLEAYHAGAATVGTTVRNVPANASARTWKVYAYSDDPASALVPSFQKTSYDSDSVYTQIRAWISSCKDHDSCLRSTSNEFSLPSRVLEITDGNVRLLETGRKPGLYVALSYCWGGPQPSRLLKENYATFLDNIDMNSLPQTILDAIVVTRKLGYEYLWVDSMCITQDDAADKLREISNMAQIYSDSHLTICATKAMSCREGFLHAADMPGLSTVLPDVGANYACTLPDGRLGHVRFVERAEYRADQERLSSRGWAIQENLLSRRVVKFGACLSWECDQETFLKTGTSLNGGIDRGMDFSELFRWHESNSAHVKRILQYVDRGVKMQARATLTTSSNIITESQLTSKHASTTSGDLKPSCPAKTPGPLFGSQSFEIKRMCSCEGGAFWTVWGYVVSTFSDQSLSEPSDKLPAVAGLAEVLQRVSGDRYLAGLWEGRMLHELMWWASPPPNRPTERATWRRLSWRAPSWSWASLDAHIGVVGPHRRIIDCQLDHCELLEQREVGKVVNCAIELQYEHVPFGEVKGGSVRLAGPLRKVRIRKDPKSNWLSLELDEVRLTRCISLPNPLYREEAFAKPRLDLGWGGIAESHDFGSAEEYDVWCLQMREEVVHAKGVVKGNATLMDGLLLLPVDEASATFRRVGVWVTDFNVVTRLEQHPFADQAHVEITMV